MPIVTLEVFLTVNVRTLRVTPMPLTRLQVPEPVVTPVDATFALSVSDCELALNDTNDDEALTAVVLVTQPAWATVVHAAVMARSDRKSAAIRRADCFRRRFKRDANDSRKPAAAHPGAETL
jgi:hypothetical protein